MLQLVVFCYICAKMLGLYVHLACLLCTLYFEHICHICSEIYVKCVYSVPNCMIDASDFICGTYMHIHQPYMPIKYFIYLAYMPHAQFDAMFQGDKFQFFPFWAYSYFLLIFRKKSYFPIL